MYCHKKNNFLIALTLFLLSACSAGLQGGNVESGFTGIQAVSLQSPTSLQISWQLSSVCNAYKIYQLSSNTDSTELVTATIPPVTLNSPNILSDRNYIFAVGCVTNNSVDGLNYVKQVNTWQLFSGNMSASLDQTGQQPVVVLGWNYLQNQGITYQVFAKQSVVPGDLSAWQLSGADTPICETTNSAMRIGPGGDCSSSSLISGTTYNFKVIAVYPDGTKSLDYGGGTSIAIPSAFTPPNCVLTSTGIGPDVTDTFLFLRCDASSANAGSCPIANSTVRAYQVINGSAPLAISDTLNGAGTLRIQPQISANQINDRVVQGLELHYGCTNTTPAQQAIVHYDNSTVALSQPTLKYPSANYEEAPVQSVQQSPSFLGQAIAIGDFNCDGSPDIAVGLPYITFDQAPYNNLSPETGAVKIYYDYVVAANGSISSASNNYQYISFRDLPSYAHFGAALSAGNINRDVAISNNNVYSCDDLIIGAPGSPGPNPSSYNGAAYVFYGNPQGFSQPLDSASLSVNAPTCSGPINAQTCSPVKLQMNDAANLYVDPVYSGTVGYANTSQNNFGFSVAYIQDFNADGYGDFAIGNPNCNWDGEITNGAGFGNPNQPNRIFNTGCVYVYFGGKNGISVQNLGRTPDNVSAVNSPYAKIYAPIPQAGMHFGYSIAGGGDIDGRLPVPVKQNNTNDVILANGADFVVGAPDFTYLGTNNSVLGVNQTLAYTLSEAVSGTPAITSRSACGTSPYTCPVDPIVMISGSSGSIGSKVTAPWNGAWAPQTAGGNPWNNVAGYPVPSATNLQNSTGIAFAYLGRSAYEPYALTAKTGFNLFPNLVTTANISVESLLSANLKNRQNGSNELSFTGAIPWQVSPNDSFYNCGPRGELSGQSATSLYPHYSCFAGRNNFSVIYPILNSGDAPVLRFGSTVAIAGAKDQNAIAAYQLSGSFSASAYQRTGPNQDQLQAFSQGTVHTQVQGTNLWEAGITGLNVYPASSNSCETFTDASNATLPSSSTCLMSIARSPIGESYNFPASAINGELPFTNAPNAAPTTDLNRDGYADILIGTTVNSGLTQVYTYFGNYAADFAYSSTYSAAGACTVDRTTTMSTPASAGQPASGILGTPPHPFQTFKATAAVMSHTGQYYWVTSEYPAYQMPAAGQHQNLSFLGDTAGTSASSSLSLAYATVSRGSLGGSCTPQRKTYATSSGVTSLATADMNNDGVMDGIIGFAQDNNSTGKTVVSISNYGGAGIVADSNFTSGTNANSKAGTFVAGTNWKFLTTNPADGTETSRRDLFSGAPGYTNPSTNTPGAGIILNYSASGNNTLAGTLSASFLENSNSPNALNMQYSKIIGDINGDGYDDIWIPVKRVSPSGSYYYDAIIYFGSSFGPVTTLFCQNKVTLGQIFDSSNAVLDPSACQASIGGGTATIAGAHVNLPQYITQPSSLGALWALNVFSAGDVDHDGKGDIIVFDSNQYYSTGIYLFFGSNSGFVNGVAARGLSSNHSPQLVTTNGNLVNYYYTNENSYDAIQNGRSNGAQSNTGYTFGDFNGDGYSDIAFSIMEASSPQYTPNGTNTNNAGWSCSAGSIALPLQYGTICGGTGYTAANPGSPVGSHGMVMVIYGGPNGLQTPVNVTNGLGTDYDLNNATTACTDFYSSCYYNNTPSQTHLTYSTEVYGSLVLNYSSNAIGIDTTKTSCDPNSPSTSCTATVIRNPIFLDKAGSGSDIFQYLGGLNFGSALQTADINGDGVDDLIIGMPNYYHPGYSNAGVAGVYNGTIDGGTTQDQNAKGALLFYYGSKGAGIVAPGANNYVTDRALGTIAGAVAQANHPVFAVTPPLANATNSASIPELDRYTTSGVPYPLQYQRDFGINITVGDFNGDGYDDVAAVSANGQLYIYYGPLCQIDNVKNTWWYEVYSNHNKAIPSASPNSAGDGVTSSNCNVMNLNVLLTSNSSTANLSVSSLSAVPQRKSLFPQMITVSGVSQNSHFGTTLLSKRPNRTPAANPGPALVINNPGNFNGDPDQTSDLIIASSSMNDASAVAPSNGYTGLGYVLFGHKDPNLGGSIKTDPGLYLGQATYNSNITSTTANGVTKYYYTPVILKPHTSDGTVAGFFFYRPSVGDLNGDGEMDTIVPTSDIFQANDGSSVVNGGGFKMIY